MTRTFDDPILELTHVMGGDPEHVLEFADTTDEEAETVLQVLAEVDAEERAAAIGREFRRTGQW
jgi:hypothetical protein